MPAREFDIGILTDEVSRDLAEALEISTEWGLRRFELREGAKGRFPAFSRDEIGSVESLLQNGGRVTAVTPGILKGPVDDRGRVERELNRVLPRSIELARRFDCPVLIVFGFERYDGEPAANRLHAMRAFTQVAEAAANAGMTAAIENEPRFWLDEPRAATQMLEEIGHPALKLNWDPANTHWGGRLPTREDFEGIQPLIANLHVKDYFPADPETPWRPVGQGSTPWREILSWIINETDLPHATLETHCEPLFESSRQSLDALREITAQVETLHSS